MVSIRIPIAPTSRSIFVFISFFETSLTLCCLGTHFVDQADHEFTEIPCLCLLSSVTEGVRL